jgi:TonB-linked SusC/RagA family outer membrane protein
MNKTVLRLSGLALPALLGLVPSALSAAPARAALPADRPLLRPDLTVRGRVVDEKGQGLPGVTVLQRGTTNGTSTDAEGRFTLTVPDDATLVLSYVGYATQEVAVGGRSAFDVAMAPDTKALQELVVVGYLTQNREEVTGSVATVSGADTRRAPVATVGEAIQGRLAGVQVTNSGAPGQAPLINIRGVGTLTNGSTPLFVVDGMWIENIRDFNPQDVESVQVLKDAASLAPYGARGANGVIIITTRKGKAGEAAINLNAYAGVQTITQTYELAGAQQWATLNNQAHDNAGVARLPFANALPAGIDTDWQDELIQQGSVQDYNVGFSGGGPNSNFLISGGYFGQKGTVVGPRFDRYSLRINTGFTRGKLKVGENALLTHSNQARLNGAPFIDALRMLPVIPVSDPANPGGYGFGNTNASTFGTNPIALQRLLRNTSANNRLQGNIFAEYSFFDFLRYRLNLGADYLAYHDREKRQYGQWRQNDALNPSYYAENQGNELFTLVENTLTVDKSFGDHNLTAVAGYTEQRFNSEFTRGRNNGYGTGPIYYWALSAGSSTPTVEGNEYTWTKRSWLGQLTYDYNQRYLLTGAIRRDGSSRFSPDNRWGTFWAASAGWRISREAFFEGVTAVSNLKLRASYGALGNETLTGPYGGSYLWQGAINPNVNYPFGGDNLQNGSIQTQLASTDIAWEDRRTTNVGFDLGLLEDRLTLTADYYTSETRNALVRPQTPIILGNAGEEPYRRVGRVQNRGFELQVGYNETRTPFRYGATANLTTIKNKVLRLSDDGSSPFFTAGPEGGVTRTEAGYEVGSFYLYQFDGIFQSGDNIAGSAQPTAQPGDVRYRDVNGDNTIDQKDRVHVGRVFPKLQYGLNLTAGYGGFDLSAFFQGVQGNDILNTTRWWLDRTDDNGNYRADFNPWTPQNPSTTTPRALISGGGGQAGLSASTNARLQSTRWLESGSYLRLKNIQLGYSFPKELLGKVKGVGSLRIYVTGQNLFTITDYSGYDPEVVNIDPVTRLPNLLARGVDEGSYPNLRTITGGIQLGF